jgi:DtxR family Mn-dependent transcriptional regulator
LNSAAIEDYLKAIYELQSKTGEVSTTRLAQQLAVTPASVTNMLKKLADLNLVHYRPYRGALLTEAGQKQALKIISYFRLTERYLIKKLGVPEEQAQAYADAWEHVLSEAVAARMRAILDYPTIDPTLPLGSE